MPPVLPAAWAKVFERQAARSPGTVSLALSEGSSSAMKVTCVPDDPPGTATADDNLTALLTTGLEDAVPSDSHAGLVRTLPVAHPRWFWHFLERVSNIQGVQFDQAVKVADDSDTSGALVEAPTLSQYGRYREYELDLLFQPRPYPVLDDSSIHDRSLTYYDAANNQIKVKVRTEWERYTEIELRPAGEYLTCQLGQYAVNDSAGPPEAGGLDDVPIGRGEAKILVPSQHLLVRWYRVPYDYVLSSLSYFDAIQGHINQGIAFDYPAGSLLFQGTTVLRVYTPFFPGVSAYTGNLVVSDRRLCDLELTFLVKNVIPISAPNAVTNRSYVQSGHNLVPYGARQGYYYNQSNKVETKALIPPNLGINAGSAVPLLASITGGAGKPPLYPSAPFELLFQNPDKPLPAG